MGGFGPKQKQPIQSLYIDDISVSKTCDSTHVCI